MKKNNVVVVVWDSDLPDAVIDKIVGPMNEDQAYSYIEEHDSYDRVLMGIKNIIADERLAAKRKA